MCTYCWGNDTMSCNYTAVRLKTVKQGRTKREQSLYSYHMITSVTLKE